MTDHDMDLYTPLDDSGKKEVDRTCGTCANFFELCCDYGVCCLRLESKFEPSERFDVYDVLDWADANLIDSQEDTCNEWEGAI